MYPVMTREKALRFLNLYVGDCDVESIRCMVAEVRDQMPREFADWFTDAALAAVASI